MISNSSRHRVSPLALEILGVGLLCAFIFECLWTSGGLLADDYQYLFLVKGLATGRPFQHLDWNDGSFYLFRPFGYPLTLTLFWPGLGRHWEGYAHLNVGFAAVACAALYAWLRVYTGRLLSLLAVLALLSNPVFREWQRYAYSDVIYVMVLVLFFCFEAYAARWGERKSFGILLCLSVFALSLRTAGLPLVGAFAIALVARKKYRPLGIFCLILAIYGGVQYLAFKQVPGLSEYFHLYTHAHGQGVAWISRLGHNLHSLVFNLFPALGLYTLWHLFLASLFKNGLGLCITLITVRVVLSLSAFQGVVGLYLAGYLGMLLMMKPEDVVHRLTLLVFPFLLVGLAVWANQVKSITRGRTLVVAIVFAVFTLDGFFDRGEYHRFFTGESFAPVDGAGEGATPRMPHPSDD